METQASSVALRLGAQVVFRGRQPLSQILASSEAGLGYVLRRVSLRNGSAELRHEICDGEGGRLYTNPRMWPLIVDRFSEPLVRAVRGPPGEPPLGTVVDAMAGLGGTALRLADTCGPACRLVAVEVSSPLACLMEHGMQRLAGHGEVWSEAASRVEVVQADAQDFLAAWAAGNGAGAELPDVVYLNPCLDVTRPSKEDLLLHKLACLKPVGREMFEAAVACAQRRVAPWFQLRSIRISGGFHGCTYTMYFSLRQYLCTVSS
ncbi:unnamed protein product [Polarella glacialis]|uniref:Trimethylguanosine synthase n=1 Tax=Polarella glacialis TaxID=89957 RepID=A0A813KRC3_POLGL|nr:unnamed protein product [Polarella glacialis]